MVLERVREIIAAQLHIDTEIIEIDMDMMTDLDADSLDAVEIIMAVEEEYDLTIPDDDAEKFRTVRDLVEYVGDKA